jgi:hypothetical protein
MRANEFLINEASVFKQEKNQYVPGYRMAISTKGGGAAVTAIKNLVPDFDQSEELSIVTPDTPASVQIPLTRQLSASFKLKRANGQVIELQGTESGIESSLNGLGPAKELEKPGQEKMPNKGDTAEALLGAAMFSKMRKRENGVIGAISTQDIWNVFDKMQPVADNDYMVTSKDMGGATDKIWFRLKAKGFVKAALTNPVMRKKLDVCASSPANYVNSKEGTDYAEQFYKNGTPDELGIISDGLSEQSARKSDVFTVVRDPVSGDIQKELLPVSLKAGAEQFAQHSGSKWQAMADMFGKMGIPLGSDLQAGYEKQQGAGQQIQAAADVYSKVADIFNSSINTDNDEAAFLSKVTAALRGWATGGNDNVRLVSFGSRGSFEVLKFDDLLPKMKNLNLQAEAVFGENPKLIFKDPVQGVLFHIRTYIQQSKKGPYQRNVIEKGPLLGKIANAIEEPVTAPAAQVPDELAAIKKNAGIVQKPLAASKAKIGQPAPQLATTPQPAPGISPKY